MKKNIICVVILILVMTSFTGCAKRMDMEDYIKVEFSGSNGKGKARIKFNDDEFAKKALLEDGESEDNLYGKLGDFEEICKAIDPKLDKKDGLSNGDKVKITYKIDKDVMDKYNISLTADDKEYEVTGLK